MRHETTLRTRTSPAEMLVIGSTRFSNANLLPLVNRPSSRDITRMLNIDLTGKRALVAGVADDAGSGFAIAKALAEAGASVCLGTWPPALGVFQTMLERGKLDRSLALSDGGKLAFERIYPLDADFDVAADVPAAVRESKRYRDLGDVSIAGLGDRLAADFGSPCLDI